MKWLFTIDTENDVIVLCRLMNIFRRKGIRLLTLAMSSAPEGYRLIVVAEAPEADVEHHFNFLRRTEGVQHVAYYRHESSHSASFVFVDGEPGSRDADRWQELFPGAKTIFASHGKALFEIPSYPEPHATGSETDQHKFLRFACVKTTRSSEANPAGAALQ
jgi:hypothetical protein